MTNPDPSLANYLTPSNIKGFLIGHYFIIFMWYCIFIYGIIDFSRQNQREKISVTYRLNNRRNN